MHSNNAFQAVTHRQSFGSCKASVRAANAIAAREKRTYAGWCQSLHSREISPVGVVAARLRFEGKTAQTNQTALMQKCPNCMCASAEFLPGSIFARRDQRGVTTSRPMVSPDSNRRCASATWSIAKVAATWGLTMPSVSSREA